MAFAGSGRSSVILPGIRAKAGVFSIRIIRAGEIRPSSFAGSVFKVPMYLLFDSLMKRSPIFHAG
jgi:hypothetical protein